MFLRLLDSKEQFFAGNWQVDYNSSGSYVFGTFPEDFKEESGQKMYYISNDKIQEIKLSGFGGEVTAIREDPTGAYIFIEITGDNNTVYCIAKDILGPVPSCKQLDINKQSIAKWNDSEVLELALKTKEGVIYSYDPVEGKMDFIDPDEEKDHYQELASLYTKKDEKNNNYWRLFNMLIVKDNSGLSLHRIPIKTKRITWLNDSDHLLIQEQDKLSVLELSTNKLAPIIEEKEIGSKNIVNKK